MFTGAVETVRPAISDVVVRALGRTHDLLNAAHLGDLRQPERGQHRARPDRRRPASPQGPSTTVRCSRATSSTAP